ncbi:unnamed protein product [Euphydryas editha]|uniref:Lipase n=2 Tax=Euphydryas editha TaxID=104508 RepID=A0AAU9UEQ6_EUPED|nr:unnamed protein product [Euphydryas editha]
MFGHCCLLFIIYQIIVLVECSLVTILKTVNVLDRSLQFGHPAIPFQVTTEDGYILQLFHLPGEKKPPVLLMHGAIDTADTWLVRGNGSLAITLANAGYDVWLGNCRGNRYSRRHVYLDPDNDPLFWEFSFHEHAVYDLPAIIDTILDETGSKKLNAIGHSQGNTIFYILGSIRPEYNEKVNLMIALAPVCYLHNIKPPLYTLFTFIPLLNDILKKVNINELFGTEKIHGKILKALCSIPYVGYTICIEHILFPLSGADPEEFDRDVFKIVNTFFPASISRKNLYHFGQIFKSRRFERYDYGVIGNKAMYNSSTPPSYDLKKVVMRIALIVGLNDKISSVKDIDLLRNQLPNMVNYTVSPRKTFNHMDDTWGKNMAVYLFPYIFDLLKEYS